MLAASARLTKRRDFAETLGRGSGRTRVSTGLMVMHVRFAAGEPASPPPWHMATGVVSPAATRVGFIVARSVGPAVVRNLVKRRLRAMARAHWDSLPRGACVVVRALPRAGTSGYAELHASFIDALSAARRRSPAGAW